jgi:hypothetical protein
VPDGYIPRLESKERECWKFLDWRLNSENDSRLHGQPSIVSFNKDLLIAFDREDQKQEKESDHWLETAAGRY